MRPRFLVAAALLAAALLLSFGVAVPAAWAQEDPWTLRLNPFRRGLDGWTRLGPEKSFTWTEGETSLAIKGQSGKEPPRLVYGKALWERGAMRLQAKKGARKLRLVLVPEKGGAAVGLEAPRDALQGGTWCDLALRFDDGRAALLVPVGEGKEREVASAALPAEGRYRMGFEAPSGTEAVVSNVTLERVLRERPPFHEPEFEPVFDGTQLAPWEPGNAASASVFRAERGVLVGEVRVEDYGWLVLGDRSYKAYELRMNALWSTTALEVRAVDVPGEGGQIHRLDSVQVNLTDHLDPEIVNEVSIRAAEGKVVAVVNGKKVLDVKTKDFAPTPISFLVARGKRCMLRDIRIRDLAPEATERSSGPPSPAGDPPPGEKPAGGPAWTVKGGFSEKGGTWTAENAEAGTGLVQGGTPASFELRFKVGKGTAGLSVLPRAGRGVTRSSGIRLDDAHFAKAEWTEVVLRVELLTAKVLVGGAEAGFLDLDQAAGPPGLRVDAGGSARVKDLVLEPGK